MKGKGVLMLGVALAVACIEGKSTHPRKGREPKVSGCPPVDPRPYTIHLPHPRNCSMFLRCDHGLAKPEPCPAPLHFNPVLQVCDWPERAGCVVGESSDGFDKEWADADPDNESEKMQGDQPPPPSPPSSPPTPPLPSDTSNFIPEDWSQTSSEETDEPENIDDVKDEEIFYTDPE